MQCFVYVWEWTVISYVCIGNRSLVILFTYLLFDYPSALFIGSHESSQGFVVCYIYFSMVMYLMLCDLLFFGSWCKLYSQSFYFYLQIKN